MITIQGLTKRYGDELAVHDLTCTIRPGVVTGFLGPNGAGKSTTMRLMLGLDSGEGEVLFHGRPYRALPNPARAVGALLDARAAHPGRSALQHLRMIAAGAGISGQRVREVLAAVGLDEARHRRIGGFSLGMQQRLGIAAALLGDPEHVVLDEPTNGLDPEGVRWIRSLLRNLADEGRTVFVSSHLLSEIAQFADDLVVIGEGRLIAAEPVRQFITANTRTRVVVRTPEADKIRTFLRGTGFQVQPEDVDALVVDSGDVDAVSAAVRRAGLPVRELHTRRSSLEDAFFNATANATSYRGGAA
ncbi:ATP-binding cassette domain-containing protein [Saccharopolyspora rhizosphaerae]|uniref:ATP-binding cassette domain-containing protein n=1 Tax=Saccharopolyspora rhizosphaerae TaxID=2492662 RepID=A0A426JRH1_9PSEU|nr:ATP-binding cassette domain-containing protein [Saccharopolyspora rhizosphaerae]RRO15736.1 ATP-binding cassette domain-containing protein [Saccharopolyspora rhizosphaerae]